MKTQTRQLLTKAQDAIEAADLLYQGDKPNFAVSCAYYAMFYVAEALLFEKDLTYRKHTGVQAAFGKHFAKTGILDPRFHRYLLDAFESRLQADYSIGITLSPDAAQETIQRAQEFLAAAEHRLATTANEAQNHD